MVDENERPSLASASVTLALLVDMTWCSCDPEYEARVLEFLAVVKAVGHVEQAITLRLARMLAWVQTRDVQEVGYPGWKAFVKEHSPWGASQTRAYVGLAKTQLDVIKEAASNNEIDLTVATRAPSELGKEASPEAQLQWIAEVKIAPLPKRHRALMDVLSGHDMRRVVEARDLGAILIGGDAPTPVIDDFLMECEAQQLTSDQILERARATPPPPDRIGTSVPEWKEETADALLGPWAEPSDLKDAVVKLRAMEVFLDQRRMLIGMAYFLIRAHRLWNVVPGCTSLEELCVVHLDLSQRSFQRYASQGRHHHANPQVRKEIEEGRLTLDRALFAMERSGDSEHSRQRWLELVRRMGRAELHHAEQREGDLQKDYGPALAMAQAVEAIVRRGKVEASEIGSTAARIAEHLLEVGATGPIQVALRDDSLRRLSEPQYIFAPPELLAAADYVLDTVVLPPVYGPRRIVEHDRYTCQNPRCRRCTIRVHPHHIHERQHGGTDDPSNLVTLCPACHLRGIHSFQMSVVRIDDWLGWIWPNGVVALMDSRVSDLTYERRRRATNANAASHTRPGAPGVAQPQPLP